MLHALVFSVVARVTPPPTPPPLGPIATPSAEPLATPSAEPTATPSAGPLGPSPSPTPSGPQLTLSTTNLELNPAQQQTILVSGASPPLQATLDAKLVTVSVSDDATRVTITATQKTGSDTLHLVDANGAQANLPIRVAFNAGTIPATATLQVTGSPADGNWLLAQVEGLVRRLTLALPGAVTTFGQPVPPAPTPLPPGANMQVTIPVTIAGNGQYFDQSGSTVVTVQNVPADPFKPALLFYDDDPEHVTSDGVLYRGAFSLTQPARLYYYHDDRGAPRRLVVLLSTTGTPASVQVIAAAAGPNEDVMSVGSAVTRKFLTVKPVGEGTIAEVRPDVPYVLADVPMAPLQGVAGNLDLRVLSGGPVVVTVLAVAPGLSPLAMLDDPPLPGDGHHRTGTFALGGFGDATLTYAAGGPDASLTLGDRDPSVPNVNPTAPGHDYGDYGVLHDVTLNLSNPTAASAQAYLYLKPLAGPVRGSFLVNGQLVVLGCVRAPFPYLIAPFTLAPGATSVATVQTMTDGGSFFPVDMGVTGSPPVPVAPPIGAPDGCFPKRQNVGPTPSPLVTPATTVPPAATPSSAATPSPMPSATPVPGPEPPPPG